MWGRVRRVWEWVDEPRVRRVLICARYGVLLAAGLLAVTWPPLSIESELGRHGTIAWGVTSSLGAFLGVAFSLRHWWLWERIAIWICATGWALYAVAVVVAHFSSDGPGNRLVQAFVVAALLLSLIDRYVEIVGEDVEPGF